MKYHGVPGLVDCMDVEFLGLVGFLTRGCLSCWFLAWWPIWLVSVLVVDSVREWTGGPGIHANRI